jgi:hypothetical protein
LGITISSDGEEIVKDLRENTKMMQIGERAAERRLDDSRRDIDPYHLEAHGM